MKTISFSNEELQVVNQAFCAYMNDLAQRIVIVDNLPEDVQEQYNFGEIEDIDLVMQGYRQMDDESVDFYEHQIMPKSDLWNKIANA